MYFFQNTNTENGKFDEMRPHMELAGIDAKRAGFSAFKYKIDTDHDGIVMLAKRQINETNRWTPIPVYEDDHEYSAHREYTIRTWSPKLPPRLSLDSVTGEISGVWEPAESEIFDYCSQVQIEAMDLLGRKSYSKVRIHLYLTEHGPEHLSYPSAYAVVSPSRSLELPSEDMTTNEDTKLNTFKGRSGRKLTVMKGVQIIIPAQIILGYPQGAECRVDKLHLPQGLALDLDTGDLSGLPMQTGDFELTIEACNSAGS